MMYIHQTECIAALPIFSLSDAQVMPVLTDNRILAQEPSYAGIPSGVLRRMGKSVRMGVGAAMPLLQHSAMPHGIIIGSASGGKEDCVKFLNQIIAYDEGMLTPMNFVQSTPNAVAAQIGLLTHNHGYNISHLHQGLAFEFALIDADMMLMEHPEHNYLVGAVDDISTYNYIFEDKQGWYKKEQTALSELYQTNTPGSIAGEAAVMFMIDAVATGAKAQLLAVDTLHHEDTTVVAEKLRHFITSHLPQGQQPDLLLTGENGDNRLLPYYTTCEAMVGSNVAVARFKHLCGEFPTASAIGLWLCCQILEEQKLPLHMIKKEGNKKYNTILLYNTYKGNQHSFMLVSVVV